MPDDAPRGYGWAPGVQRKVVAFCLRDPEAWGQLGAGVFDARWITHPPLKEVAVQLYRACAENGGRPPSPEMLEEAVRERAAQRKPAMAEQVRQELAFVLTADLSDMRMVRAKAAAFARTEACAQAALKAAELIDRGAIHNGHGSGIIQMFQSALAVGQASEAVVRMVGEPEIVVTELERTEHKVPTGFGPLDKALDGGMTPGLHMMAGAPKIGKTAFLTQLSAAGCRCGYTVWHVSGENTLRPMCLRMLCAMTGYDRRQVKADPRRSVDRMAAAYSQAGGEIILEYAPGFTVDWMAARLRQLESQGHRIGLVVADFIDLMRGAEKTERRWELEDIGKRLRDLSVEVGVPVVTAKALNRKAVTKAIPTEADLAECFGLVYVVENLWVLCSTQEEQQRVVNGRPAPVIRIWYAVGREDRDRYLLGAWDRNNDRQRWTLIPGYLGRMAEEQKSGG